MIRQSLIAMTVTAGLSVIPSPASAQDAAETAIIISGTGAPQARASRGLGSAISGAMQRSTSAIRVQPRGRPRGRAPQSQTGALPEGVDALEGTDAPAYTLGNGATIRVSGRLNPAASTVCTKNCATGQAAKTAAEEETPESSQDD